MEADLDLRPATAESVRREVLQLKAEGQKALCVLKEGGRLLASFLLGRHIRPGDEMELPLAFGSLDGGTEIYVHKNSGEPRTHDVYQVSIGYVARRRCDKREQLYVHAEVSQGHLGISALHIPCDLLRDHLYVTNRGKPWDRQVSLYETLRIPPSASLAELRLAFKLRALEFHSEKSPKASFSAIERAFNILARPELRACYDGLLKDSSAPAIFPYGGFGSILVAGNRSRDGQTFFVTRILAFSPERRVRRFRIPLRKVDFYDDRAVYRDARRKMGVVLDQSVMPIVWDGTWNQWEHFLGTKIEIQGTFVEAGKYRQRGGKWQLARWETALPSRLQVKLPGTVNEQIEVARKAHHRFGQFADALEHIRARIDQEPIERSALQRVCWDLGIPGDFDVSQITWKPDFDAFYYRQLCRRARRLYLFREEYIFDLEKAVVVETPQLGHATYLFSKPRSMEQFLAAYIRVTKEDVRRNRHNIGESLGFLGRIVHGVNGRLWLRELKARTGEAVESSEVTNVLDAD